MSGRVSPFAALTGAEKQLKWLEVQSVRLPYVQGALEQTDADTSTSAARAPEAARTVKEAAPPDAAAKPAPPAEQAATQKPAHGESAARAEFQKTRHRQYDAVIARMRQAELNARGFRPVG